jgi:hypothetical protein
MARLYVIKRYLSGLKELLKPFMDLQADHPTITRWRVGLKDDWFRIRESDEVF